MDAKDLRTEAVLGDRSNDGTTKYTQGGGALPCHRNKTYQDIGSNSLGKVDMSATRPCAVIGPDRVVPPPVSAEAYLKKGPPLEPWLHGAENMYRRPPDYPHKILDYQHPSRNISPRQTFQENMQRIMVSPSYNAVKLKEDNNILGDTSLSQMRINKVNASADQTTKYCDVPYTINPTANDQKTVRNLDNNGLNMNSVLTRNAPQSWPPASANVRPPKPYPQELYQYPEYPSCAGPRPMLVPRPRTLHEEPGAMYPEGYYHDANVRFKPYPPTKERYPQSRYEYVGNYPFHTPAPSFPTHKYDLQKTIPPHPYPGYPQVPIKYVDSRLPDPIMNGYQRPINSLSLSNQQPNYNNLPYRNQVIHPNYGSVPGNCLQTSNKYYPYPPDSSKPMLPIKAQYDPNIKVYSDYENNRNKHFHGPEGYYLNDLGRNHTVKGQVLPPNYSTNLHAVSAHPYYRKDNGVPIRAYDHNSHYRNIDPTLNLNVNTLPRFPSQFSPNPTIAISPSDSNTSIDASQTHGTIQEDCGYVSQSSTASTRSIDTNRIPLDYYRRYDHRFVKNTSISKRDITSNANTKQNKDIDVRQFLQMWNEGEDENGENNSKETALKSASSTSNDPLNHYESNNQEQLYVLGLVNVPSEELGKYEHIQKVSKLPENIKGYNGIELLHQFEEVIETSNLNNMNIKPQNQRDFHTPLKGALSLHGISIPSRPLSPLDVESKISQSVIHKEVGCNFEIKPCSPKMLNVEVATPMQTVFGERVIEKVSNPLIIKSPNLMLSDENKDNCSIININKCQDQASIENAKISSCKMKNTPCNENNPIDTMKTNYSLQVLESGSGVCLASLPRLDNDIELNFPEVNQQFIQANKGDSVITAISSKDLPTLECSTEVHQSGLGNNSSEIENTVCKNIVEKDLSKLSKYRKIKRKRIDSLSTEANVQAQRKDSVIIKNPDNNKVPNATMDIGPENKTGEARNDPINLSIPSETNDEKHFILENDKLTFDSECELNINTSKSNDCVYFNTIPVSNETESITQDDTILSGPKSQSINLSIPSATTDEENATLDNDKQIFSTKCGLDTNPPKSNEDNCSASVRNEIESVSQYDTILCDQKVESVNLSPSPSDKQNIVLRNDVLNTKLMNTEENDCSNEITINTDNKTESIMQYNNNIPSDRKCQDILNVEERYNNPNEKNILLEENIHGSSDQVATASTKNNVIESTALCKDVNSLSNNIKYEEPSDKVEICLTETEKNVDNEKTSLSLEATETPSTELTNEKNKITIDKKNPAEFESCIQQNIKTHTFDDEKSLAQSYDILTGIDFPSDNFQMKHKNMLTETQNFLDMERAISRIFPIDYEIVSNKHESKQCFSINSHQKNLATNNHKEMWSPFIQKLMIHNQGKCEIMKRVNCNLESSLAVRAFAKMETNFLTEINEDRIENTITKITADASPSTRNEEQRNTDLKIPDDTLYSVHTNTYSGDLTTKVEKKRHEMETANEEEKNTKIFTKVENDTIASNLCPSVSSDLGSDLQFIQEIADNIGIENELDLEVNKMMAVEDKNQTKYLNTNKQTDQEILGNEENIITTEKGKTDLKFDKISESLPTTTNTFENNDKGLVQDNEILSLGVDLNELENAKPGTPMQRIEKIAVQSLVKDSRQEIQLLNFDDNLGNRRALLKRSLSDSALNNMLNNATENAGSVMWPNKRKRFNDTVSNMESHLLADNYCNIVQSIRRNSISSMQNAESVSFCILIDDECIIDEEESRKICFTEVPEECFCIEDDFEDGSRTPENISLPEENDYEKYDPVYELNRSQDNKIVEETWVEDIACVETVVTDDIAENIVISASTSPKNIDFSDGETINSDEEPYHMNEHTEKLKYIYGDKMCNDDSHFMETLYRTPQMNVDKTLSNRESHNTIDCGRYYDRESLEMVLSEPNNEITYNSSDFVFPESLCLSSSEVHSKNIKLYSSSLSSCELGSDILDEGKLNDLDYRTEILENALSFNKTNLDQCESSTEDIFAISGNEDNPKFPISSSSEVSSTTSEDRNSGILLKIKNYARSRVSQVSDINNGGTISCKYTEQSEYLCSNNNTPIRPLLTKAAQKYIPPLKETLPDLKVKLPLPQHSLMKLKQLKVTKEIPKPNLFKSNTNLYLKKEVPKKFKPKFEDVLMSIDEIHFQKLKEKHKKVRKSIPKVVIKKSNNGSHYASTSNEDKFNPDLTGRKWQPWVFIEKNSFIDKMALSKKTKAIYNHRKNIYVLAEKFQKYKSAGSKKFVISQPCINDSSGPLKYTIKLKHQY